MTAWIRIAVRNLSKNRRRSVISILAIALGFAAVNLFGGFKEYMYSANSEAAIFVVNRGHLTIFKKGFLDEGELKPDKYLLTEKELDTVQNICQDIPNVALATPQLRISGLLTNGKVTTIFMAQGIVPSTEDILLGKRTKFLQRTEFEGKELEDDHIHGVALARGLAHLLDLKIGSNATAFTTTIHGQMNALDIEVYQLFDVGVQDLKDKIMRVPLGFAQAIYDTDGADRISVLLDNDEYTDSIREQLQAIFSERGFNLEVKTWEEMATWYRKIKGMFDAIFVFLFAITFAIVVTSVVNTMSMTVFERTREIGTLRALGLKRRGVLLLFSVESTLLGVCGTIAGLLLTFLGWAVVDLFKPTWVPPGTSVRLSIVIEAVPSIIVYSFFFMVMLCLIASLAPARRAAQQNVVDALGHV